MAKKKKIGPVVVDNKYQHSMKLVTSSTCINCKKQCKRGLAYIEKMSKSGATGKGVPCILTKGKAFQ